MKTKSISHWGLLGHRPASPLPASQAPKRKITMLLRRSPRPLAPATNALELPSQRATHKGLATSQRTARP